MENESLSKPKRLIQIFTKAPIPGNVKTRLAREIGPEKATELHISMFEHILSMSDSLPDTDIEIWYTPEKPHSYFKKFKELHFTTKEQTGEDLGDRMFAAIKGGLLNYESVILVGSDCPFITTKHLQEAFDILTAGYSYTFIPAVDGGFVLIGATEIEDVIFGGVSWGSSGVMNKIEENLTLHDKSYRLLIPLRDIDRKSDLKHIPKLKIFDWHKADS
jgi:rSAM/selenodomain-associated transferase 1